MRKSIIIIIEVVSVVAATILLYLTGNSPKPVLVIGVLVIFLSWAMLEPPTKYREISKEEKTHFKGPFAKPSISPPITIESNGKDGFSIKRHPEEE